MTWPVVRWSRLGAGVSWIPASLRAATWVGVEREPVPRAPHLGEHTDAVLADVLKLDAAHIGRLHDAGLVAGAAA